MENWKRNCVFFLVSQSISLFGSSLVQTAIAWYITLTTKSGVMMSISIVCGIIPTFLVSLFAGVWADRYNKKLIIIFSDGLIALSTLVVAILFLLGYESIPLLFALLIFRAIGTGIQTPAVNAALPQFVPDEKLTKINGINTSIQAATMLLSPMLSAALLTVSSILVVFFVDIITALMAILVLALFLKIQPLKREVTTGEKISFFADLMLGFKYIQKSSFLKKFFILYSTTFILLTPVNFLTILQTARLYGDALWKMTAIEVAVSVGMIIGGILISVKTFFNNSTYMIILASVISGICTFILGLPIPFIVYLIFLLTAGIMAPIFSASVTSTLQIRVEREYLGRIFGVSNMLSNLVMAFGMILMGSAADMLNIGLIFLVCGVLFIVQGICVCFSKEMIKMGDLSDVSDNANTEL